MPTAISLVDQVRDELSDYGDLADTPSTTVAAPGVNEAVTSIPVADSNVADVGDFIYVEYEAMLVTATDSTAPGTFTVLRAQRGTAGATHATGQPVRVNLVYPSHRILRALNAALMAAYPVIYKLVTDETLTVQEETSLYDVPASIVDCRSFWVETSVGSGQYELSRLLEQESGGKIRYWDAGYESGSGIRIVGMGRFSELTIGGNLDTDYPTNQGAIDYLVLAAIGRLLTKGIAADVSNASSDVWAGDQSGDKYAKLNVGKQLLKMADEALQKARMVPIPKVQPRADRRYYGVPAPSDI